MSFRNIDSGDDFSIEDAIRHNEEMERRESSKEKGGTTSSGKTRDDKPKKCINAIYLDEDIWQIIIAGANEKGLWLPIYCAMIITEISTNLDKMMDSRSFRLRVNRFKAREYFDSMEQVEMMAVEYNLHPTFELAERLAEACDDLGVDIEQIKSKVKDDPLSEVVAELRDEPNNKTNQCIKWLRKLMIQNNYRVSARMGNSQGIKNGFSRDMISRARRRMSIESVPEGADRYWIISSQARAARAILSSEDEA